MHSAGAVCEIVQKRSATLGSGSPLWPTLSTPFLSMTRVKSGMFSRLHLVDYCREWRWKSGQCWMCNQHLDPQDQSVLHYTFFEPLRTTMAVGRSVYCQLAKGCRCRLWSILLWYRGMKRGQKVHSGSSQELRFAGVGNGCSRLDRSNSLSRRIIARHSCPQSLARRIHRWDLGVAGSCWGT